MKLTLPRKTVLFNFFENVSEVAFEKKNTRGNEMKKCKLAAPSGIWDDDD